MNISLSKKVFAEFFGTLVLVLMGCGSAVLAGNNVGFLGIAFAFGFSVVVMAYTVGSISGCHLNPAVTISMLSLGKISVKDAFAYIAGQITGAISASGILYILANGKPGYSLAANGLGQNGVASGSPGGYSLLAGLIAEIVFTCIFLVVIHSVTSKMNKDRAAFGGLIIGFTLTLIHIVGIPLTGVSVNPARSIGPALFVRGEALSNLWVFILGPVVGGMAGGYIWSVLELC